MDGKIINPNDPVDNPEAFSVVMQPVHPPSPMAAPHSNARKPKDELPRSKEGSIHQPNGSSYDSGSFRRTKDSHNRRHRNQTSSGNQQRRSSRLSGGGSNDRGSYSPLRGYSPAEGLSETSQAFTSAGCLRMTNVRYDKNVVDRSFFLSFFLFVYFEQQNVWNQITYGVCFLADQERIISAQVW